MSGTSSRIGTPSFQSVDSASLHGDTITGDATKVAVTPTGGVSGKLADILAQALTDSGSGAVWNYRGAWAANTAYAVDDVVTNAGSTYLVTTAFTSGATFDATNLGLIAAAGENGDPGLSAFAVAQANGFTGTQQQWLESLVGATGDSIASITPQQGAITAGQPSDLTLTVTLSDNTKLDPITVQLPAGAAGKNGTGGGGSSDLVQGDIVQPTGIVSSADLTASMAALALPASSPLKAVAGSVITIDPTVKYQEFLGVGGAFTAATAYCLTQYMTEAACDAFLQKMFGDDGFNCIRICFGSSDYEVYSPYYSYADDWDGADVTVPTFSIARDQQYLIPLLQKIVRINPRIWITAGLWSPPGKMKDSGSVVNGNFNATTTNYQALANYCVKAIQAYQAQGIPISAITFNEPQGNNNGYPCCGFTDGQLTTLYGSYLGPALADANLTTEIIATDTSWGSITQKGYGMGALSDATASQYTNALGFHGYNGNVQQMPAIVRAHPTARIYFTEWISAFVDSTWFRCEKASADLLNNMIRAGARVLLWWNIALDQNGMPYELATSGSHICRGMATINNTTGAVTYNSDYVIFAHIAKFVQPGAHVIKSNVFTMISSDSYSYNNSAPASGTDVTNIAFRNPDGSIALFMWNPLTTARTVTVTDATTRQSFPVTIPGQSFCTVAYGASDIVETAGALTAPSAPTLGTPTVNGSGQVQFSITPPASIGSTDLGGYAIYAGSAAGAESAWPLAVLPSTATLFTDTSLSTGATRFYTATALGGGGESAASVEVSGAAKATAPGAPSFALSAGDGQIQVTVQAPASNGGAAITGYPINIGTTAGGESSTPVTTLTAAGSYTITGLTNGTKYYVIVGATNSVGTTKAAEQNATPASDAVALPAHYFVGGGGTGATAWSNAPASYGASVVDMQVWMNLSTYTGNAYTAIFGDYGTSGKAAQQSSGLCIGTNGTVTLQLRNASQAYVGLNFATPIPTAANTAVWLRPVVNGSAVAVTLVDGTSVPAGTARLYTSADGKTWTQLGADVAYSGTIQTVTSSAASVVCTGTIAGKVYKALLYAGADGKTLQYGPDFTTQATGATSFTDAENIKWNIASGASIA